MFIGISVMGYFTPWWVPVIWIIATAFVLKLDVRIAVTTGAMTFALVWLVMARYMDIQDRANIIEKTGTLMGGLSHQLFFILLLIVGLITGALAGWFGSRLRPFIDQTMNNSVERK